MIKSKYPIISTFILIAFLVIVISIHLKILFLFFIFLRWRRYLPVFLNFSRSLVNKVVLLSFILLFAYTYPSKFSDGEDYIQSVYYNVDTKEEVSIPVIPYMANIIGEGDIMSVIAIFNKLFPVTEILESNNYTSKLSALLDVMNYMNVKTYFENNFQKKYRILESYDVPPHNVPFQILQGMGMYKNIDHYFLHIPKDIDVNKAEIIVFCHGLAGNWLLYPELFAEYTNSIIISVETPNFSGYFNKPIINSIINNTLLSAYAKIGISIKKHKPHLIGLSNGGSAVNTSLKYFPNTFKTFTILSAGLKVSPKYNDKVSIIYGRGDKSGGVTRSINRKKYKQYIVKGENHTLLVSNPEIVFNYINNIIN